MGGVVKVVRGAEAALDAQRSSVVFIIFLVEPLNEYTYIRGIPQTESYMRQMVIVEVDGCRRVRLPRGVLYEINGKPRFPDWM
jgi:hypothetical protein